MAPPTWATQEQQDFILTFQDEFLECKKKGNFATFWAPFFEKWEERWPLEVSNDDQQLSEAQLAQEVAKERLAVQKAGRRANAAGNTIVTKLIGGIVKKEKKKSRPLKATEVYSKMYYATRVQPAVKEELNAMKEASDAPDLKKRTIQVVRRQLASRWENETVEVKEEVANLVREMKDQREKDTSDCKKLRVISRLTEILSTFFSELHDSTGWAFSILLGGPDPTNGGKLDVSSLHIGTTALGNRFNQACPKFEERIMVPYFEFASHAFRKSSNDFCL
ncbi:hypothetical protein P692DRAFT_20754799 [Suillus brevipes Sb2]|nr:hypothetical protein P692DRAFT_20754799 [Suillus brevipes Sb2]